VSATVSVGSTAEVVSAIVSVGSSASAVDGAMIQTDTTVPTTKKRRAKNRAASVLSLWDRTTYPI
jgi:hypothetical protein